VKKPPVLIVFCREPAAGHAKTRLLSHLGAANAASLAEAFVVDMLAKASTVCRSELVIAGTAESPVTRSPFFRGVARRFHADLIDQGVGALGARMSRVLEPFAPAAGALLIGTDLPSLPVVALRHLYGMLQRRELVLGPSLDGGYYAIGVRGAVPPVFHGIRWGSARVFEQTVQRITRTGRSAAFGPAWYDVDRWSDLLLLCEHLKRIESTKIVHPCPATANVLRRLGLLSPRRYITRKIETIDNDRTYALHKARLRALPRDGRGPGRGVAGV
jgi:rSAM/selenodomain-associated transferase 1